MQPFPQKVLLGGDLGLFESLAKMSGGNLRTMKLRFEFAEDRVKEIIRFELLAIPKRFESGHSGRGAMHIRHGNGAIESDYGLVIELHELIIKRENLPPVGSLGILSDAMAGGDASLKMVCADFGSLGRLRQMKHASSDHRLVPARSILLTKAQDVTFGIGSRRKAGCV